MLDRRKFLQSSAFLSLAPVVPAFLSRTARAAQAERDGRILVVLQLDGGNDGINTVVPFGDESYAKCRRQLRLPSDRLFKVGEGLGLHPSMRRAAELFESDRLAIVQGVGYPNPDRSHFESMAIWQTATPGRPGGEVLGWLGKALDAGPRPDGPASIHVGDENMPRALTSRRAVSASFADAADLALALRPAEVSDKATGEGLSAFVNRAVTDAYATAAELEAAASRGGGSSSRYPDTKLAKRLDLIARSIRSGSPARVYYAIQSGYDSHSAQLPTHARLLGELAGGLKSFLDDLAADRLADRVVVMAFSEFGRRPEENGSLGTDHGTAGPLFVAGPAVNGGLFGKTPSLGDLEDGDLKRSSDFRSVYATLLDRWLALPADAILGEHFDRLPFLDA